MIHTFTRRWGVFFYSFLAALLCGGYEAGACLSTPDEIKLPGSTFTAERITVGKAGKGVPAVFSITFGDTLVYHHRGCWYNHEAKQCLTQMVRGGGKSIQIDKNGRKIGVLEWDDKSPGKLEVYSMSGGSKDPKKPHLKFIEHIGACTKKLAFTCIRQWDNQGCVVCEVSSKGVWQCPEKLDRRACMPSKANQCVESANYNHCVVSLTVTAHEGDRVIGKYSIGAGRGGKGLSARNLTVGSSSGQRPSGILNLNGKEFSSSGCSVNVKPYKN